MSLAGLIPTIYSFYLVKKYFKLKPNIPTKALPLSFYKFGLASFITNLSLTSLYNSDVLLVRFFISHQSGIYATISILGKIIFFVSTSVLTVSFPIFTTQTKNLKKLKTSFTKSLSLITTIAFVGLIFYQLYPNLVIKLFSNPDYTTATTLLPGFSLFIFFFTILNLVIQFFLTINKQYAVAISFFTALLQITLIILFHQNLTQIIQNSIIATLTSLLLSLILFIIIFNDKTQSKK